MLEMMQGLFPVAAMRVSLVEVSARMLLVMATACATMVMRSAIVFLLLPMACLFFGTFYQMSFSAIGRGLVQDNVMVWVFF